MIVKILNIKLHVFLLQEIVELQSIYYSSMCVNLFQFQQQKNVLIVKNFKSKKVFTTSIITLTSICIFQITVDVNIVSE